MEKTKFEKMRSEEFYDFTSEECLASYFRAKHLCAKLQTMTVDDDDYRKTIEELIPGIPESSMVAPPFHCDHGHGIKLGENVFINYNGTMLDGGIITIGSNTQIGPNCQFLTPNHPIDYVERRKPMSFSSAIFTIRAIIWSFMIEVFMLYSNHAPLRDTWFLVSWISIQLSDLTSPVWRS